MGGTFATEFGLAYVPKTPFIYGFGVRECFFKKGLGSSKAYYKGAKMHGETEGTDGSEKIEDDGETMSFTSTDVAKQDLEFDALGDMEDDFELIVTSEGVTSASFILVPKSV